MCASLLNGTGDLMTKDMEKLGVLNAFLTLAFTGMICHLGIVGSWEQWEGLEEGRVAEDQGMEHLNKLNTYKSPWDLTDASMSV